MSCDCAVQVDLLKGHKNYNRFIPAGLRWLIRSGDVGNAAVQLIEGNSVPLLLQADEGCVA